MKKLLLLAALLLATMQVSAANVDLATARATASRFMLHNAPSLRFTGALAPEMKLAQTVMNSKNAQLAALYIFNSDAGYAIVSGDDRAKEVLAWGDYTLDIKNIPPGLQDMINQYRDAIEFLQANPTLRVDPEVSPQNTPMLRASSIGPLLPCNWDQEAPYYNQCTIGGYQCLTGCPATSASMVFYYWKYPTDPTPVVPAYDSQVYYSYWGSTTVHIDALPSVTFDWDNMLDNYGSNYTSAQGNAVATLMRYVGQAERMDYGTSGAGGSGVDADSVCNIADAFTFFGYDPETVRAVKKVSAYSGGTTLYTDAEWAAMIQEEMFAERPVVFCAVDNNGNGGHAFNVDGYNGNNNTYHINFGWSGDGNNWCSLNAFSYSGYNFSVYQQMVMGIQPPASGPSIKVSSGTLNMEAFVDQTATATLTVKGQDLSSNITLTLNDPSGYYTLSATSVGVSEQENGKVITVTYHPESSGNHTATITLSNPAAEDKVVTLNGTAVIDAHTPVMLPADEAYINLTQFRADWTDETADKYVDSYTLQVGTKPGTALLEMADFSDYPNTGANVASQASQYIPEGWTFNGSGLYLDGASIEPSSGSTLTSPMYDLAGYEKVTVIVTFRSWSSWTDATLKVGTSQQETTFTGTNSFQPYTAVLNCAEEDHIVFTAGYYPMIQRIEIYAGELDAAKLRAIVEEGDATSRLITGITDKNYTVKNLEAAGTFYYKVKAIYVDGTESPWSKSQMVTLFENGHGYDLGDVNHDGTIGIEDVTTLIDYILGNTTDICTICADVTGDGIIGIADVTGIIDIMLNPTE